MGGSPGPVHAHKARDKAAGQNPTLEEGAKGYQVKRLQRLLKDHHFDPGAIDGIFGPATKKAVVTAQKAHGLNASCIAGVMTWHAIIAAAESKTQENSSLL